MKPKSLFFRLMGAFALVIVVGFLIVFLIANQATAGEFRVFMFRGQMLATQDVANQLSDYYRVQGSWQGVESLLERGSAVPGGMMSGGGMGHGMSGGSRLWLASVSGVIVASSDHSRLGEALAPAERLSATPIRIGAQSVGLLAPEAGMMDSLTDPASQQFLSQVNGSLLLAGLVAGLIAVALGFLLFRQITAPLNALAVASKQISGGNFHARVTVRGDDEIAQVGRSFNAMADNLARSETARRNMLADVAHELRNPIGVIQSHLEAMLDGVFPTSAEQIASLHDETMSLTRMVDDLRTLALADAGQLTLSRQISDLRILVSKCVQSFQADASERGIALSSDLGREELFVKMDPERIAQVLRNLLLNALIHTPSSGKVVVSLEHVADFARVTVTDSGPGIPTDLLPFVFDRFWRADKSRTREQSGAGLGLAIAKQSIKAHSGEIGVESDMGGQTQGNGNALARTSGTTFWFTLPL